MRLLPSLLLSFASTAHAVDLDISMSCWDPSASTLGICGAGSPDVRVGDDITFNASLTSCTFFCDDLGPAPWRVQFRSNVGGPIRGTVQTSQTGNVSFTWAGGYSSTGDYQPEVRACATSGGPCTDWDTYDVAFVGYDLNVGDNQSPEVEMDVWDPNDFFGVCPGAGSVDGFYNTEFTFSAEVSDPEGDALEVQWDFDGDGTIDDRTSVGGNTTNPRTVTTTHTFNGEVHVEPAVRVEDALGARSDWDSYDCGFANINLDVPANMAPDLAMEAFEPNDQFLFCPGDGGADGQFDTEFTFTAVVSDPEGERIAVEWDYDNDGTVDARTPNSGFRSAGTLTSTWTYGQGGSFEPAARALDAQGAVGDWERYSCAGVDINLDVVGNAGPELEMLAFEPNQQILFCAGDGTQDGSTADTFTFTATVDDDQQVAVEWDFDDDGTVDLRTPASGFADPGTFTATHVYPAATSVEPRARGIDALGAEGEWDKYDCGGFDMDLDVIDAGPPTPPLTFLPWEPNDADGACLGGGDRDGRPSTSFLLTVIVDDPQDDPIAIEWDFDGDGDPDLRTPSTGFRPEGTIDERWTPGEELSAIPAARVLDQEGAVSSWVPHTCNGQAVRLDAVITPPEGEMLCWEPSGNNCSSSPDGVADTEFTFSATYADGDEDLGGRVDLVEWDFDGDGVADESQSVPPGPGTATITHTYNAVGVWVPAVRFTDDDGAVTDWFDLDGWALETWSAIDTDSTGGGDPIQPVDTMETGLDDTGDVKDGEGCECGTGKPAGGWLVVGLLLAIRRRRG